MIEQQIAAKIKAFRRSSGLTLEQLARRTGLSKGLLSRVENRKVSPPIATLARIAQGLGVPIASFFDQAQPRPAPLSLVRRQDRQSIGPVKTSGPYTYYSLTRMKQGKILEPFVVTFAVDDNQDPADLVNHAGEELLFVIKGRIKFTYGQEDYILEPGDAVHFEASLPHKAAALGGQPAECLILVGSSS
ncbi:MAG: helix-turn-helix transcriptional regulator [Deltaproteobacteria bacterium]|nr:helix-turn-helix transcriptional regulator [Deltaproteobacteria bacterium]